MASSGVERGWGPDRNWGLWLGEGVVDGLVQFLDQMLAIPKIIHDPLPESSGVLTSGDLAHGPRPAALGVVPWLTYAEVIDRLQRMHCCVVVDKQTAIIEPLTRLNGDGVPFPSEAVPGFHEEMGPVDDAGRPMVVDPGTLWPPRPPSIGPVRVWGYRTQGPKPLAHTKLLVVGKVARFKNYAWPEGGPGEYQTFLPEAVWFGSANWTGRSATQHLEMGAFTTDPAFIEGCLDYVSRVVLESEPLGSKHPTKQPEMQPIEWDDEAFHDYFAEFVFRDDEDWNPDDD